MLEAVLSVQARENYFRLLQCMLFSLYLIMTAIIGVGQLRLRRRLQRCRSQTTWLRA